MVNDRVMEIAKSEARLREAMLASDVTVLDELLAPDLIFTSHLGQILTKEDDLEGHRSGNLKVESLTVLEENIKPVGELAIVSARIKIEGIFSGAKMAGDFRFTRVWQPTAQGGWQVIAAHSSLASEPV